MSVKKSQILLFLLILFLLQTGTSYAYVKYDLAYPGILPDNPLYKVKVLRDKIEEILIPDPKTKMKFYLLQADKGISATAILVDKNKLDLANQTALRAENNMTLLTYEDKKLGGRLDESTLNKLKAASLKHQEVLESLIKRVPENDKKTFENVIDFSKRNLDTINKIQNRKNYY